MHADAFLWVDKTFNHWKTPETKDLMVLEFGSLNINGGVKSIFQPYTRTYVGVDLQEGPGVDFVEDAHTFHSDMVFDVVVCCEVFEHTPLWREIISNAHSLLRDGGLFVATMAGEGRYPHSAIDENPIRDWEYYDNVGSWELNRHLGKLFSSHEVNTSGADLRCSAVK